MKNVVKIPLKVSPEQGARLRALQHAFAEVCNTLAPKARDERCWNRVALHHMMYRTLRDQFPQLGSQMVCNAIYSVSRTCRRVYQAPGSPFNIANLGDRPLPLVKFASSSPVYFDRHTLSIKDGRLSMYTLDGRMRFELNLARANEKRFHREKLLEIMLSSRQKEFWLTFVFDEEGGAATEQSGGASALGRGSGGEGPEPKPTKGDLPEYVVVLPAELTAIEKDLA